MYFSRVREALDSRDLDALADLFDALWYELPARFSSEVVAATATLTKRDFDRQPRLFHLVYLSYHQHEWAGHDLGLRKFLQFFLDQGCWYSKRLASFSRPEDLSTAATIAVISARLRGALRESQEIGRMADSRIATHAGHFLRWNGEDTGGKPGWLSMQRGLSATLAGQIDSAVSLYVRAHTESGPPPYGHFAGANAAANLALLAAYQGHLGTAQHWRDQLDRMGPVMDWVEHLTTLGAKIAGALIALAEGDDDRAARCLKEAGPAATPGIELWPFIAYTQATYDIAVGDADRGLARLDETLFAHGASRPVPAAMTGRLLLQARAKLLVAANQGHQVLDLVRQNPSAPEIRPAVAWVHHLAGHHHQAIRTAAKALQWPELSVDDRVEMHLVTALSHQEAGDLTRAGAAFMAAMGARSSPDHVRPFLRAPTEKISALAALTEIQDPLGVRPISAEPLALGPIKIVRLTDRETAVLQELSNGLTAEKTAQRLGVAVSTVRTQIRSIYRKLGVSRRDEALARAQELRLLPTPGSTGAANH